MDLRELKKECHAEAAEIVAHLAEDHAPPMPVFGDSRPSEGETTFGDDAYKDDKSSPRAAATTATAKMVKKQVQKTTASSTCRRRKSGAAPVESGGPTAGLARRVVGHAARGFTKDVADHDCYIFLQDAVQGMLKHEGSTRSGGESPTPRPRAASTTPLRRQGRRRRRRPPDTATHPERV